MTPKEEVMPACSGKVLHKDGSPAAGVKVEGVSNRGGMIAAHTRRDGSFDLSTSDTTGEFTKIYAKGQLAGTNMKGSNRILYLK